MGGGRGDSITFTSVALTASHMSSSRKKQRREDVWGSSSFLWSTSVLEVFMAALRAEFISQSHAIAYYTATGFDPWLLPATLATEIKSPAWRVNEWNRPCVVGGRTEGNRGGEITLSARGTALTALQILQSSRFTISFALASLTPSEKLFLSLHLEYSFQANQGIFLQWELRADDHPFYRNLLCITKRISCTQAYISKYNSSSFPSLASFAKPPMSVVHLQTCSCDCSPPALHCPAPLGAAGRDYQPEKLPIIDLP